MDEHTIDADSLNLFKNIITSEFESHIYTKEMFFNPQQQKLCCILDSPDEKSIRDHHVKFGIKCDSITQIQQVTLGDQGDTDKLQVIGELAARLAHDLRNPLSVIKNVVEIMESKPKLKIEEKIICYGRLHRAINRISHQIDEVLDFVRPSKLTVTNNLLNEIVISAIEKIAKPDNVKINLPNNFVYVPCDFIKFEVMITNLIMNAIQAMNNSGQVDVRLFDDGKYATLQVIDSGCGIPKDVMPRIFEPLFTTKQIGTGLGLASCKAIVEQHKGIITVTSSVGKGTTFTIRIPKSSAVVSDKSVSHSAVPSQIAMPNK
ncbi:ATP-binding protein [Candidatus Nitrosotenuis chungbukensis]|uniref:ATP-binding protein n=1 Tax=Candidatus Nitrosotenuis chungbukensis TaxID=1353246 RepID=UPI0012FF156C|nr:ATP-binding protein [Candidatus Nitrosotenuis chungbukensis]